MSHCQGHHASQCQTHAGLHPGLTTEIVKLETEAVIQTAIDPLQCVASLISALPGRAAMGSGSKNPWGGRVQINSYDTPIVSGLATACCNRLPDPGTLPRQPLPGSGTSACCGPPQSPGMSWGIPRTSPGIGSRHCLALNRGYCPRAPQPAGAGFPAVITRFRLLLTPNLSHVNQRSNLVVFSHHLLQRTTIPGQH